MWAVHIVGSLNKVLTQFKHDGGYVLGVITRQRVYGLWKSVTWSGETVVKTTLIEPDKDCSVEITDLVIVTDKTQNAIITLAFEDGTNTETLIVGNTTNAPLQFSHTVGGRFQAWRNAILKYTVAGGNSTGTIIIGYVYRSADDSEDYPMWNSKR